MGQMKSEPIVLRGKRSGLTLLGQKKGNRTFMQIDSESVTEVVGTCKIEFMVREGSPLLEQMLSQVGIDGLPPFYSDPTGRREEVIESKHEEVLAAEKDRLGALADHHLVAEAIGEFCDSAFLALEILAERIAAGSTNSFVALIDALSRLQEQDIPPDSYLEERYTDLLSLFDTCVAAARTSVDHLTERELENIINKARTDSVTCAARQRLEEIYQQRIHLATLPTMPLNEIIVKYNRGIFFEPQVRRRVRKRLERETMGEEEIADMLPFGDSAVEDFLEGLGIARVGYLIAPRARCRGTRWGRKEVMQTIQNTTARLLFRAMNEFHGPLPDHLDAAMMLAPADEYQRSYVNWLKQNGW